MKKIKLMPEFCCDPVWYEEPDEFGVTAIDLIDLPISKDLFKAILKWAKRYDAILDQNYPPDSEFKSPAEREAFIEDGSVLAKRLQEELGNDYNVTYYPITS